MELQFKRVECPCLDTALRDLRNMELTQEIRLPEGMPDVGKILCAWGQPVLRGKEWRRESVNFSGGLMAWVLYEPEDGSRPQCIEEWIPFQMNWDLPEATPEGTLRIRCLPRFVDARSASARKIMVRAGIGAMAEAFVPAVMHVWEPEEVPEDVALLKTTWPVRMPEEAGEKTFSLDEELELSGFREGRLLTVHLEPRLTDKKVLGNKLVFRGSGNLHVLCMDEEGMIRSWDLELPFSQFAQLDKDYGSDAMGDVVLSPTALEPELTESGHLRFKGGMTAQYLISDRKLLTVVEDAYSPERTLEGKMATPSIPVILENRRENIYGEQTLPGKASQIADVVFYPDFPRQRRGDGGVEVEQPGQFQVLYYGPEGNLQGASVRWEGRVAVPADEDLSLVAVPGSGELPRATPSGEQISLSATVPVELTAVAKQSLPMLSGMTLGQPRQKDPNRPSLILRRAGCDRLWDIAKENGSTVDAIRRINALTEEPDPDRMLLIPVP